MRLRGGHFLLGDCFDRMATLAPGSVDMVLCDLPYGTTQNKWDAVIPFEPLWREIWRVTKPDAAVVLTAAQPFTAALVMSQPDAFAYEWIWHKSRPTGHLNAKRQPLREHENIPVFYRQQPFYDPQMFKGKPNHVRNTPGTKSRSTNYGAQYTVVEERTDQKYPRTIIPATVVSPTHIIHPTQKPVALFEYLIRTYTREGETVLDMTAGSGTTAIAAERAGRQWVCIEKDPDYYWNAVARVIDLQINA